MCLCLEKSIWGSIIPSFKIILGPFFSMNSNKKVMPKKEAATLGKNKELPGLDLQKELVANDTSYFSSPRQVLRGFWGSFD